MMNKKILVLFSLLIFIISATSYYALNSIWKPEPELPRILGVSSPSNITYTLNCALPDTPESIPALWAYDNAITVDEAKILVSKLTKTSGISKIESLSGEELMLFVDGGTVHLRGYNNLLYLKSFSETEINTYDEEVLIQVANNFKDTVLSTIPIKGITVEYDKIQEGTVTITDGVKTIHTMQVVYKVKVNGIEVAGAVLAVDIVDNKIYEFEFHLPNIDTLSENIEIISPEVALNKLLNGDTAEKTFGYSSSTVSGSERTIERIKLVYYYRFLDSVTGSNPTPIYVISGVEKVRNATNNIIVERDFTEIVLAH